MYKRVVVCGLLLVVLLACHGANTPVPDTTPAVTPSLTAGRCGDGVCGPAEDAFNCPADCTVQGDTLPGDEIPPLYFFYAIHTHGTGDYLPYQDDSMQTIDPQVADNMLAAIEGIAEVMDRYGARGTWEVVYGTATGLCTYQGPDHVFAQLQAAGHEIGAHAHQMEDIARAVSALQDDCGIVPQTNSGFITFITSAQAGQQQAMMSLALQNTLDLGMTAGTVNFSPGGGRNPFGALCDNQLGVGNDMWPQSGNLMFPWQPDYANQNVCAHDPTGEVVLVDHVSIEWLILPGSDGPPDVVGDAHFAQLQDWFDAALDYMAEQRPQRVAAWGFVTHITEYAVGGHGEHGPDPQALAALDRFLAYVDTQRADGRVVYTTAAEIADLVAAEQ